MLFWTLERLATAHIKIHKQVKNTPIVILFFQAHSCNLQDLQTLPKELPVWAEEAEWCGGEEAVADWLA